MENIKLLTGEIISVKEFELKTNKEFPYYQESKKYALCPSCDSSVQIIGGSNNGTQSSSNRHYAAHTSSEISGLNFCEEAKENCPRYEGNENNWQKIYNRIQLTEENERLKEYIENNKLKIAEELEGFLGFKMLIYNNTGFGRLFEKIYNSFIENNGLYISNEQFDPDYVSRLLLVRSAPVECWGSKISNDTVLRKIKSKFTDEEIENDQFKPSKKVEIVGVLDNDNIPTHIKIKLIIEDNEEIIINNIRAKVNN